ncbi:MAG: phosphoadenylyl-sulfate reductase [bacterium]|nr:phosphoadenylyl-sulfate reductase [bacterium]
MNPPPTKDWAESLSDAHPDTILAWAAATFPDRVALASSLGLEDQVLTDLIARYAPAISIFTLDTGRLFPESHDLIERTERRYGLRLRVYHPDVAELDRLVAEDGVNGFRQSIDQRRACCRVRKITPLRRALAGLDAWVCGLRRGQSVTREAVKVVEWDEANGLVKINPLAGWSEARVRDYIAAHDVPYHPLHDRGYPSIGCACCTRAVAPGEDERAGRWWWEAPEHKECGLHARAGVERETVTR